MIAICIMRPRPLCVCDGTIYSINRDGAIVTGKGGEQGRGRKLRGETGRDVVSSGPLNVTLAASCSARWPAPGTCGQQKACDHPTCTEPHPRYALAGPMADLPHETAHEQTRKKKLQESSFHFF